jgi:hypothetical protein
MRRAVLAALALCTSCPASGPTLESFCTSYVDAVCGRLAECNGATAAAWCVVVEKDRLCGEVTASERAGRTRFHGAYADACLTIVASLPCRVVAADSAGGELDVLCSEALEGQVTLENPCTADRECMLDSHCDRSALRCPGTCRRLRDANESCDTLNGVRCAVGLSCVSGTCGLPLTDDAGCSESAECESGLFCDPFLSPPRCAPWRDTGPCREGDNDCAPRFACTADAGCAAAKQDGEGCTVGARECNLLLSCVGGACQTWGRLGEPCGALAPGEEAQCLEGDCISGTCTQLDAGAACTTNASCGRGAECLGTPRVCVPRCAPQ